MSDVRCDLCREPLSFQSQVTGVCIWCWARVHEKWCPCLDTDTGKISTRRSVATCDRGSACVFPRTVSGILPIVSLKLPPRCTNQCHSLAFPPPNEHSALDQIRPGPLLLFSAPPMTRRHLCPSPTTPFFFAPTKPKQLATPTSNLTLEIDDTPRTIFDVTHSSDVHVSTNSLQSFGSTPATPNWTPPGQVSCWDATEIPVPLGHKHESSESSVYQILPTYN
jgi:hypothetical protein